MADHPVTQQRYPRSKKKKLAYAAHQQSGGLVLHRRAAATPTTRPEAKGREVRRRALAPRVAAEELAAALGRDLVVELGLEEALEFLFLRRRHVVLVALAEDEEGLVPEHGELPALGLEAHEVPHQGVHHAVRERVPARAKRSGGARCTEDRREGGGGGGVRPARACGCERGFSGALSEAATRGETRCAAARPDTCRRALTSC